MLKRKLSDLAPAQESSNQNKVCLQGIERYIDERSLLKFYQKTFPESIKLEGISKKKGNTHAFLAFETVSDRESFEKFALDNSIKFKNKNLQIRPVTGITTEKKIHKILESIQEKAEFRYKPNEKEIENELAISIQKKVCPYWDVDYNDQIIKKKSHLNSILSSINLKARQLLKEDEKLSSWMLNEKPCEIEAFLEAPENERFYYRNKAEFTIGKDYKGNVNVGFNRGNFNKGLCWVEEPKECPIVSKESIEIALKMQEFIRERINTYDTYDKFDHTGFWRNIVIRQSNRTNEIIISIVIQNTGIETETLILFKEEIKNFLLNHKPNNFTIKGILFQVHNDINDNIPTDLPYEILYGESNYNEIILEKSFQVSPSSFLQIHIPQSERLYKLIGSLSEIDKETIFLDICSGIGTIGICLADSAAKILAVEMVESACKDAELNSKNNKIENYVCKQAKVEDVIDDLIKPYVGHNKIVGVVDPPRAGLHSNVLKKLRTCKGLDNLVYVSCNPNALVDNLMGLCLPQNNKNRKGPPFAIVKCFGVDLFPQTEHYECVMLLKRVYGNP